MGLNLGGNPAAVAAQAAAMAASKATSMRMGAMVNPQAGDTVTATTANEQTYASTITIGANSLIAGQSLIITGNGVYTTPVLNLATQRARCRIGGQVIADTGPMNFPLSLSGHRYWFYIHAAVQQTGVNGKLDCYATLVFATSLTAAVTVLCGPSGTATDAANPVTIDTTQPLTVAMSCQFGGITSGQSNSMRAISIHGLRPAA